MMITTQRVSGNAKTGPIATTYRAAAGNTFGTCPATCGLCPEPDRAAADIDHKYARAVYDAVPELGVAWLYTHFHWSKWADKYPATYKVGGSRPVKTTFNYSADTWKDAQVAHLAGVPTTVAMSAAEYEERKARGDFKKCAVTGRTLAVACPADKEAGRNCLNCGNRAPLCARADRPIIIFLAHGSGKNKVSADQPGGCYASYWRTRRAWDQAAAAPPCDDAAAVRDFAAGLPLGSQLRHHIAGDIGKA